METNIPLELLKITIPLILGGGLGYFLKYYLEKKQEIQSQLFTKKREMYKEFVAIIVDLIITSKDENQDGSEYQNNIKKSVEKLYEFYESYLMYSSPKFINSFGEFMQYVYSEKNDLKTTINKLAIVITALRSEVGLSNKGLGKNGERVFMAIFKDYADLYN